MILKFLFFEFVIDFRDRVVHAWNEYRYVLPSTTGLLVKKYLQKKTIVILKTIY